MIHIHIPSFIDSKPIRLVSVGILYFAQGLPSGLFGVSMPTWLAEQGHSTATIATFMAIGGTPWALKFLSGPLMDRFQFPAFGHRRPWIVFAQTGLVLSFLTIALVGTFSHSIWFFAWLSCLLAVFAATQDVAVDGMAIGILKDNERAKATAIMFGGQAVGFAVASTGGGYLLNAFGLPLTAVSGAVVAFAILLIPLFIKERSIEKRFPWSRGHAEPAIAALQTKNMPILFVDLVRALIAPTSLLLVAALFFDSVAGGMLGAYLPGFVVHELQWDDTMFNDWRSTASLAAAALGLLVSPLVDYFGKRNTIIAISLVTASMILVFMLVPSFQTDVGWQVFIVLYWSTTHIFTVAIIASCMQIVTPRIAASQFAIYMSISNLSAVSGSYFVGIVGDDVSIQFIMFLAASGFLLAPIFFTLTGLGVRTDSNLESVAA